ncbi:MAG: hypothetical protein ABIY40_02120 [Rhodanobacteraceae bacterium]|nr:hypothetical protein [Pseudomonadota bacterium]
MRARIAVFSLSAALLLAGCASLQISSKDKSRDDTLDGYAATLRWGDFAGAYQFVDPDVRAKHPLDAATKAKYNKVSVAGYDAQPPATTGENTIQQLVKISLIDKGSQSSYDIVDHQSWRWDPTVKRWWLESGLPDITPEQ